MALLAAKLLNPLDDVATALYALDAGTALRVSSEGVTRNVVLREPVPAGHKFSVRPLAEGLRVRKYGEYIGRLTSDVEAGTWLHEHNLVTSARRPADLAFASTGANTGAVIVETIQHACASVGESPVWDATRNRLYWVDVRDTPAIHMLDRVSDEHRSWPLPEDIGSLVLAVDGRLLLALRSGFAFFDPDSGRINPIVDPEPEQPSTRLNDAKCDPRGRVWCGSMNPESGTADGRLYCLRPDLTYITGPGTHVTPNGPVFSLDGRRLYLADTRKSVIYTYDYDEQDACLGERRIFADLGALPGGPDGAAMDSEGYLWSAQWDGGCLLRLDPDGRIDRVVRVPVSKPTSCCFAGPDHRLLMVTTARRGLTEERRRHQPLAGCILALDVGVSGPAAARFGHAGRGAA